MTAYGKTSALRPIVTLTVCRVSVLAKGGLLRPDQSLLNTTHISHHFRRTFSFLSAVPPPSFIIFLLNPAAVNLSGADVTPELDSLSIQNTNRQSVQDLGKGVGYRGSLAHRGYGRDQTWRGVLDAGTYCHAFTEAPEPIRTAWKGDCWHPGQYAMLAMKWRRPSDSLHTFHAIYWSRVSGTKPSRRYIYRNTSYW